MTPVSSKVHDLLRQGIRALDLTVSEESQAQLLVYFSELLKWNKKINLVGPGDDLSILENHFLDSLTLLHLLPSQPKGHLLDIGSGAGFPGLVVQIACPTISTTLVEPRQKRVAFLNHVCRTTQARHAKVLCRRIDAHDRQFASTHGPFSYITSRAVTNLSDFLALSAPLCSEETLVLCMKGPQADQEIAQWQQSEESRLFALQDRRQFTLPFSQAQRNLLIFSRTERK